MAGVICDREDVVVIAFDPDKTLAVVLAPDGMMHHSLQSWLRTLKVASLKAQEGSYRNYQCAYNRMVKHIALASDPARFDQFIFADSDMRPSRKQSSSFLDLDADIRCVEYQTEMDTEVSWTPETAFHTGIWWTTRHVLEAIRRPWFEWQYQDDGCATVGCICTSFRRKALDAGFTIKHGGHAGHTPRIRRCSAVGKTRADLV